MKSLETDSITDLPSDVSGRVLRGKVWKLAWPSIAEMSLFLAIGLMDVFLIGHLSPEAQRHLGYDNASALAGTSAGQFFNWTINAALMALGIASTALVARYIGAREQAKAEMYARQALLMAFGLGVLFGGLALVAGRAFIYLLGAENNLIDLGYSYLTVTAFGLPLSAVLITGNGALRGSGDTRTPLMIMACVNVINILVAVIFINGEFGMPVLGIQGSALGAVSGWTIGSILTVTRLLGWWPGQRRSEDKLRISFSLRVELDYIKELVKFGLPTLGEQMVFQFGLFFFARFIVGLGTVAYAGHSAIINIDSASFLPGMGIATATTVLVGQCLGAGRPDLAERYTISAWQMGLVFMSVMGLLFFLFPEFFLSLLVDNKAVIQEAVWPLRIAGLFDPVIATSFILIGALRGAGDTKWPMYSRMLGTWGMRVCLAFLFIPVLGMGLLGGRLAMGIDSLAVAIFVYYRFRSGRWKEVWAKKKAANEPKIQPASGRVTLEAAAPAPSEHGS